MRALALVLVALPLAGAVGTAASSSLPGAWRTFVRAGEFTALLADDDQVWGATAEAGLVRWDRASATLEIIRRQPGAIASNRLTALAADRSGRLWVASDGAGVSRRSADGRRWDVVNVLDGLPSDSTRVLEASGDTVWIGTTRGFALWNGHQVSGSLPDGLTLSFDTTFASLSVTGIALHGDVLWVATRRGIGLAHLSQQLGDWRPVNDGLIDTDVRSLASDGAALFAHAGGDVYRWRGELGQWVVEPGAGVVHRLTDAAGAVLATGESGAFRWFQSPVDSGWAAVAGAPVANGATGDDPEISLAPDGQAYAALGETLFEAPPTPGAWNAHPLPEGPPGNSLVYVAIEGPRVYVTTDANGVARYDGTWRYWPPDRCVGVGCDTTFVWPLYVNGFFADRSGRKWAGCWSIALESFRDDVSPPQFTHEVTVVDPISERRSWFVCATQDTSGAVWFGMDTPRKGDTDPIGLEVYDSSGAYRGNYNPINSTLSGKLVHGLTFTANGRVWIGFDAGGLDFVPLPALPTKFEHIDATDGLAVRGLASYGDSVWLATNTELWRFGTSALKSSQPAQKIKLRGGLPQLGMKPIAVGRDGAVWVGTSAGLKLFRPGGAIDSFATFNSPIPDDEVRAIAVDPASGALWITTAAGLARFDPFYVPPPRPPRPALHAHVYPNPALLTGLGVQLRIAGDAEVYSGAVYDLSGRRLRRFHNAGNGALVWDGRDEDGRLVPPGIYFLRAEAEGRSAVARVALLR